MKSGTALSTMGLQTLREWVGHCGLVVPWGWHPGLFSAVSSARGAGTHPLAKATLCSWTWFGSQVPYPSH